MENRYLKAVLAYIRRGWSVFPLEGKRPFPGTRGHKDATDDETIVRSWWNEFPEANVGVACDSRAGPLVLDIDGPEGMESIPELELPSTLEATSGGEGRKHFYFAPCGEEIRRSIKVRPGLDVLGDGGYVVAPPSMHPDRGTRYRWLNDEEPAEFPSSLLDVIRARKKGHGPAPPLPETIHEGERDDMLTSLAGSMRRRGASEESILAALLEENDRRCEPPLDERQVKKIARSIGSKRPAPQLENLTDMGNARRFVRQHHQDVRYVSTRKNSWVVWDGVRWVEDDNGETHRLAKDTVRSIYREASAIEDEKMRQSVLKHAKRSENSSRIRGILDVASTEPEVATIAEVFDADPWLLNVENGTIDLHTGELFEPRRDDLITKLAEVTHDSEEECPMWQSFLDDIMRGNEDLISYLQRAIGYALTGDVREQVLFFCYGSGQNGKSTFLEVIRELLGDYSQQSSFATLLSRRSSGPRNDLARMRGVRFVSAVEAPADKSFDEAVLKQLTGGDTITARRLYEEFFEFSPTHKIFLAANHKPHVKEMTEAFWRRIRLIPFTVYIPPEKRDNLLREKLSSELSGILNWALEGCLAWQRKGLGEPSAVREATEKYREEEDLIGEFLSTSTTSNIGAWTSTSDLYQSFTSWWRQTRGPHARVPSPSWFTRSMNERKDVEAVKRNNVPGWDGIGLVREWG